VVGHELLEPLVPRLALVLAARLRFQIVRIDVEGHEGQGLETRWISHRHVVGGVDGSGGHIGACTAAHIG